MDILTEDLGLRPPCTGGVEHGILAGFQRSGDHNSTVGLARVTLVATSAPFAS